MTKISRIKNSSIEISIFLNNLYGAIVLLESKKQTAEFLKDITTHTELKMLAKRIQIAKMLMEGYDYKTIKGYVKVTDSTISNISNQLENGANGLKNAIVNLQKIENEFIKRKTSSLPDLKKKYPSYYITDRIFESISENFKSRKKRHSVKKILK